MSSTNAPSSLPSDHVLSANDESRSQLENTVESATPSRRKSFPASVSHSPDSTIGEYPHSEAPQHLPTETSPLLVPRIDYNASVNNTSAVNMFWEELAVLTEFAIPVFGYAPSFICL